MYGALLGLEYTRKQFIRSKLIRFNFKIWALNRKFGHLIKFDSYQVAGTVPDVHAVGMVSSGALD